MTTRAPVLVLAAAAAALSSGPPAGAAVAEDRLRPVALQSFESCSDLVRYGNRHARRLAGPFPAGMQMAMDAPVGAMERDAAAGQARPTAGNDSSASFSGTNLQEAGVDEPDIVKTDGSRIFAIAGGRLHVVDVTKDAPRVSGTLDLGAGWGHQMLLHSNRVLLAWSAWGRADGQDTTVLAEVDAGRPEAPRIVKTLTVSGTLVTARMTGSTARVVTRSLPRAVVPAAGAQRRRRSAQWLPSVVLRDRAAGTRERRPVSCRDVRHSPVFSGLGMTTVLTVDLEHGLELVDTDTVMTDAETVYASPDALYLATARWLRPGRRTLPRSLGTTIHRFDTSDPSATTYGESGVVPGHLLSQFSMSEHDGVLRVASSATPQWWDGAGDQRDSESFVTTLRPDAVSGRLLEIGAVGGLGRGERIYAVRFIGTVGYVVTFRETDPLYTVDLSDPAAPAVLGELKIRGYSAYLHPAGDGLLIGIGQDATSRGRTLGTQVSLFDVDDLREPRRLAHLTLGDGSSSEAEYDHHAFTWWQPTGLAVVPVMSWHPRDDSGRSAAIGLRIDRSGITQAGRAEHPRQRDGHPVRRSLVVGQRLYTLSERGMLASSLDTLSPVAWLPLR